MVISFTIEKENPFIKKDKVVKKIKQDNIKILVDLSGYTAGNRIEVFFNKPAVPAKAAMAVRSASFGW